MKFLARLLAIATGLALALTLWSYVVSSSLFSASAAEAAAASSGVYAQIAAQVPALLSQVSPLTADEQAQLAPFIDPALVQGWGETLLPQLEHYYRQGGAKPQLDISLLGARVSAAGIPIPSDLQLRLTTPLTVSASRLDAPLSQAVQWSAKLKFWGPIALLIGLVLGLLLSAGRRFVWLGQAFIWGALWTIAMWALLHAAPQLISATIVNSAAGSLAAGIRTWFEALSKTPLHQLLQGAIVFAGLGAVSIVAQFILRMFHRKPHHA